MSKKKIVIIGGGAAGYFAAINAAEKFPQHEYIILEGTQKPLVKILISGGGRCNVTHHCFEMRELIKNYPRGSKELLSLFSRFQAEDTVSWFEERGIKLHVEKDGRMFPVSNKSQTIANYFRMRQEELGISLNLSHKVTSIEKNLNGFKIEIKDKKPLLAHRVILATGSSPVGHSLAENLGHTITNLCPSLFTFKIKNPLIDGLMGLSFQNCHAELKVSGFKKTFKQEGPILITHWGLSGPAILKLSAFAARELFSTKYQAGLYINWLGSIKAEEVFCKLQEFKKNSLNEKIQKAFPYNLPKRFWLSLLKNLGLKENLAWSHVNMKILQELSKALTNTKFIVSGKGIFKEEFVTAGGVSLKEINFKSMESKVCSGLYFAGEVLDIDGITGGFNFQNAWSGAWAISQAIGHFDF